MTDDLKPDGNAAALLRRNQQLTAQLQQAQQEIGALRMDLGVYRNLVANLTTPKPPEPAEQDAADNAGGGI